MDEESKRMTSLEKQLFHELHHREIHSPTIKEFNECWAFANVVRSSLLGKQQQHHCENKNGDLQVVIDVAGGHGALGALFLLLTSASRAIVVDPANVGGGGVEKAWGNRYKSQGKDLIYRHECLRAALREELAALLDGSATTSVATDADADEAATERAPATVGEERNKKLSPGQILVVACHACQHLTDETLEIACSYGVHVAVMPCCQKDLTGGAWKATAKALGLGIGPVMDLLTCGKVMMMHGHRGNCCHVKRSRSCSCSSSSSSAGRYSYQVRMKMISANITPQNRVIVCKAMYGQQNCDLVDSNAAVEAAHDKLQRAYQRAHTASTTSRNGVVNAPKPRKKRKKQLRDKSHDDAIYDWTRSCWNPLLALRQGVSVVRHHRHQGLCVPSAIMGAVLGACVTVVIVVFMTSLHTCSQ